MVYKYNSWRHNLTVEIDRKKRYQVCLFSAYSGRKLKVYGTYSDLKIAESVAQHLRQFDKAK